MAVVFSKCYISLLQGVLKYIIRMGTLAFVLYLLLTALVAGVVYLVWSPNIPDGFSKRGVLRIFQVLMTVVRSWVSNNCNLIIII